MAWTDAGMVKAAIQRGEISPNAEMVDLGRFGQKIGSMLPGDFQPGDYRQAAVFTAGCLANHMGDPKIDLNDITSQLSHETLADMGISPSAALLQLARDAAIDDPENVGQAGARIAGAEKLNLKDENHAAGNHTLCHYEEKKAEDLAHFEEKQEQHQDWLEQKQADDKFFQDQKMAEERFFEEKRMQEMAAQRPAEDQANMNIAMAPIGMGLALLGLDLTVDAVNVAGGAMSGHVEKIGDPALIATNNGGVMTAEARAALEATPLGKDAAVGPDGAKEFTPGAAPDPAPQLAGRSSAPTMNQNINMAGTAPGMNLAPGGGMVA